MSEIASIQQALFGIRKNLDNFSRTASKLTGEITQGDPAREIVDLKSAKTAVAAGGRVVQAADEVVGSLLDIVR